MHNLLACSSEYHSILQSYSVGNNASQGASNDHHNAKDGISSPVHRLVVAQGGLIAILTSPSKAFADRQRRSTA